MLNYFFHFPFLVRGSYYYLLIAGDHFSFANASIQDRLEKLETSSAMTAYSGPTAHPVFGSSQMDFS